MGASLHCTGQGPHVLPIAAHVPPLSLGQSLRSSLAATVSAMTSPHLCVPPLPAECFPPVTGFLTGLHELPKQPTDPLFAAGHPNCS